jgi:hypothetical protein
MSVFSVQGLTAQHQLVLGQHGKHCGSFEVVVEVLLCLVDGNPLSEELAVSRFVNTANFFPFFDMKTNFLLLFTCFYILFILYFWFCKKIIFFFFFF